MKRMQVISLARMRCLSFVLTMSMLIVVMVATTPSESFAFYLTMEDVDKPTAIPTTYDNYGLFTNIDGNWRNTCWQAVAASMLNYVGYGTTTDIYNWFHDTYGNVGASLTEWEDALNAYILEPSHTSTKGLYIAFSIKEPTDLWAETMIMTSPLGLDVIILSGEGGGHAIAFGGYDDMYEGSWIADPDADWRDTSLSMPPNYSDWSLFDDAVSWNYNWLLQRTWADDAKLYLDVYGAVFLMPVPEPATFLLLSIGLAGVGLLRRRFKS